MAIAEAIRQRREIERGLRNGRILGVMATNALELGIDVGSLWGDGWGWALFKADAPDKQVATDYKKDCLGYHIPAKSTDWTYVHGYPPLKSK